jgi:beta-glucosidase
VVTVLEGIQARVSAQTKVTHVDCGKIMEITADKISQVAAAAKTAELIILVIGENDARYDDQGAFNRKRPERTGGEGVDRDNLNLVGGQLELLKALHQSGVPVVVVLINGRPVSEDWMYQNVATIVEAWEPGLEGGTAVAEVLFGDCNPSGKLPVTIARSVGQLPVWYNLPVSSGLRYKYLEKGPQFPFGYGLSYTEFKYRNLKAPAVLARGKPLNLSIEVENAGSLAGEEVVLVFIKDLVASLSPLQKELKAFTRVSLKPGEKQTVQFNLPYNDLAVFDRALKLSVEPGVFEVQTGDLTAGFTVP